MAADGLTYQSTTPATVPSGTVAATDDAGAAGHVQIVKLAISTDGSATAIPAEATNGLDVDVTRVQGTVAISQAAGASTPAKAEDAASANADVGVPAMAIQKVTPANTAGTDGDYEMLQMSAGRLWASATIDAALPAGTNAIGKLAANSGVDIGDVDVLSSALPTGASTLAEQQTQTTALAIIAGDTTDIEAAVELIDDTVATLGTTTYSEATTKGLTVGAVRRDADTTLVDTTNEIGPLQMDANGRLKVEAFSGETLPVSLASVPSHAVTNAGTFATQVDGSALTALQLIDDVVLAEDAGHSTGDKGVMALTVRQNTAAALAGTDADYQPLITDANGRLHVTLSSAVVDDAAFTPGTTVVNMAGFQADEASTDSVDEGDAGAARMTLDRKVIVTQQGHTQGGLSTFMASGSDGSSILVATAQAIKASAGQMYGYYMYNPEAAATHVHFYNTAAGSVTVGTTNPLFTIVLPAGSAANLPIGQGIAFSSAGWSCAATTTAGGNTAPATGVSLVVWYM